MNCTATLWGRGTPTSKGFNSANVFTVSVPNSTDTITKTYWGRVRAIDTSGNAGSYTLLVQTDQSTPLIDNQYIGSLTAAKITAGTIGAHTIALNGANSILKSSNYEVATSTFGGTGWQISGDGKAVFNDASVRSSLDIGEDQGTDDATSFHVDVNGNMWIGANKSNYETAPFRVNNFGEITADSLTLTGLTEMATGSEIFLGAGNYNNLDTGFYVNSNSEFSLGDKLTWDGIILAVKGELRFSDNTEPINEEDAETIAEEYADEAVEELENNIYEEGFLGGLTINSTQMFYGAGTFNSQDTAFYVAKNITSGQADFSLGDKLSWDGTTLNITGNLVITGGSTLQSINDAQDDANTAYSTAISAQGIAITAETKADNAQDDANTAYSTAISAQGIAITAETKADNAQDDADTAYSTAISAEGIAISAQSTANDAYSEAITKIGPGTLIAEINGAATTISGDKITTGTLNADRISGGTITASIAMNSAAFNGGSININNSFRVLSDGSVFARNMELDYGFSYRSGQFPVNNAVNAQIFTLGSGVQRISQPGSRRELKENIQDISEGLEIVNQLKPRVFTYNEKYYGDIDPTTDEPWTQDAINMRSLVSSYGFIVEEVQEVNPQLVSYRPADTTVPMDQVGGAFDISTWTPTMWKETEIIAILTKAVQELSAKVAMLESKIV